MNAFGWLVKREYWEHKGGFFWAPVWTAVIFLTIVLLGLFTAEVTAGRLGVNINGIRFNDLTQQISANDISKLNAGMDIGLLSLSMPIAIVLFFVVFFYLLGALYDDRRDRSVLFWKSLPLSDLQTVLSKVFAATFIAPVFAVVAAIALHLGFLFLLSLFALFHGVNPLPLLWSPIHLIGLWLKMLLLVPINALWALPTVGWLLLCSSFARSKPFLWAVALPLVVGCMVSWIDLMRQMALPSTWFWQHVVGRLLLSIMPGSWMDASALRELEHAGDSAPEVLTGLLSFSSIGQLLSSPNLVIGVAVGALMIAGAVYYRHRRTEAYS